MRNCMLSFLPKMGDDWLNGNRKSACQDPSKTSCMCLAMFLRWNKWEGPCGFQHVLKITGHSGGHVRWHGTNGVQFQLLGDSRTLWKAGRPSFGNSLGLFTTASKVWSLPAPRERYLGSVVWAGEGHLKNGSCDKHSLHVCSMPDTVSAIRGQVSRLQAILQGLVIQQKRCAFSCLSCIVFVSRKARGGCQCLPLSNSTLVPRGRVSPGSWSSSFRFRLD